METYSSDIKTIQQEIKSWENLKESQIIFEKIPSLSNLIWKVTALSHTARPKSIIYRKFSLGSDFVDRVTENYIFDKLSQVKLGPQCYGFSSTFRIEEYHECSPVACGDVRNPEIRRILARNLAALHSLNLSAIDQTPSFLRNLEEGTYVQEVQKKILSTKFSHGEQRIISEIKTELFSTAETDFLLSILPKNPESIVFSHNDLHAGNILNLKDSDDYLFIDCEYSAYNYRGFDIANLFEETVFDYHSNQFPHYKLNEELYPPKIELKDFVKYYVFFKMLRDKLSEEKVSNAINDFNAMKRYVLKAGKTDEFSEQVDQLMREVMVGKLLSHYHWAIWSVTFSKKEGTKFDYIAYARDRLQLYQRAKEELLSKRDR